MYIYLLTYGNACACQVVFAADRPVPIVRSFQRLTGRQPKTWASPPGTLTPALSPRARERDELPATAVVRGFPPFATVFARFPRFPAVFTVFPVFQLFLASRAALSARLVDRFCAFRRFAFQTLRPASQPVLKAAWKL